MIIKSKEIIRKKWNENILKIKTFPTIETKPKNEKKENKIKVNSTNQNKIQKYKKQQQVKANNKKSHINKNMKIKTFK